VWDDSVGALKGTCLSRITSDFDSVHYSLERYIKVWIYFTFMETLEREYVETSSLTYTCNFPDKQLHLV